MELSEIFVGTLSLRFKLILFVIFMYAIFLKPEIEIVVDPYYYRLCGDDVIVRNDVIMNALEYRAIPFKKPLIPKLCALLDQLFGDFRQNLFIGSSK